MGKRVLQLYVDDEDIRNAKIKGINMSSLFRQVLGTEVKYGQNTSNDKLKLEISKLKEEVLTCKETIKKQNKELKDKQMKDEGWITT